MYPYDLNNVRESKFNKFQYNQHTLQQKYCNLAKYLTL